MREGFGEGNTTTLNQVSLLNVKTISVIACSVKNVQLSLTKNLRLFRV